MSARIPKDKHLRGCQDLRTGLYRHAFGVTGFHIVELCKACGTNVRGGGQWVPRREVPGDPDSLPIAPGRQRSLFEVRGGAV